ncbi:MAG: hypothetical protein FJZ38_04495 [Candidatus Rokubacteria bacterium]|nr:hypothetical protein [Candidatus Rokubacteria bacterium]
MKKLVTALVILGVCYGIYQFAIAANGWFQMSGAVEQVAEKELPAVIERAQQQAGLPSAGFDSQRYSTMLEKIMKAAEEHNVPLRREAVAIGIVDNMLEVRLAWDAPIVVYDGRPYVEIPMSMQRRFSLQPRKTF